MQFLETMMPFSKEGYDVRVGPQYLELFMAIVDEWDGIPFHWRYSSKLPRNHLDFCLTIILLVHFRVSLEAGAAFSIPLLHAMRSCSRLGSARQAKRDAFQYRQHYDVEVIRLVQRLYRGN